MIRKDHPQYTPGDLLRRLKGFIHHKGVYLGGGFVLHNTPDKGEHVSTVQTFARGAKVLRSRIQAADRRPVLQRAYKTIRAPRKYNPLTNNCEHTATRVVMGQASSDQLIRWGLVALTVLATVLARRR